MSGRLHTPKAVSDDQLTRRNAPDARTGDGDPAQTLGTVRAGHFGRVVRDRREALGWSQERLALKAEINRSYLGEVERGHAIPSLHTMDKVARALDIRLSTLLARCEEALDASPATLSG